MEIEIIEQSKIKEGEIFVVGCSSSEIVGEKIGKGSSPEAANAVFEVIYEELQKRGITRTICAVGGPCTSYELVFMDPTEVGFCGKMEVKIRLNIKMQLVFCVCVFMQAPE